MIRPLALQRAAAELVDHIPALRAVVGIDKSTGQHRGHIGSVCDLLLDAGIDPDRWTGTDLAQALTHDGAARVELADRRGDDRAGAAGGLPAFPTRLDNSLADRM